MPAALLLAGFLLAQALPSSAQKPSVAKLHQRAEHGDVEAQYWLCYHYWNGEGQDPDYAAAFDYCQEAAQSGHPKARAVLGFMYRRGQGVPRSDERAYGLLSQAADGEVARADYELGVMYQEGGFVLRDDAKADAYFCRAVKIGCSIAQSKCSETKSHFGGFQPGAFTPGQSSIGRFSQVNSRGPQEDCDAMLKPESGGVVGLGASPAPTGQTPAAPQSVPASNEAEVSLNKAVSLQGNTPPQASGSTVRVPSPEAVPVPAAPLAGASAVAPTEESRLPQKPLPLMLIAAGLLCSLMGGIAFLVYKSLSSSSHRRVPETIRSLLSTNPQGHQQIADLYVTYCKQGGQAEVFSSDELQAIETSLDTVGGGFATPGLSFGKALEVAGKLAAAGKTARMQDVLSEPMLVQAATAGRVDEVLALLDKSKSVDDFAVHFSAPGRPVDFYSAYAGGLARLGRTEQAYKMLTAKPLDRFSPEDQTLLLELHVKLGHFDQAGLLLDQVTQVKPPAAAKDYYEELAKQATMHGGERLADDLRTIAAGRPIQGAPARPPASAGKVLAGKYELRSLISTGGMGEVYDGYDRSLDRHVAIKRLLPGLLVDPLMREQFLREAKTAAHLTHPYIVPIYESLVSGDDLYLVFEFVKGETLHAVLSRRSRLALKECQGLFHYVCHALDYAHRKHVLHRDLKPANIMLDENGIARVMDFGIAVEATGTLSATFVDKRGVTGTLRYMPPEQHYGKATRASDVYALGVCLYEMATGYLPFNAPTVPEMVEQKHKGEFPAPSFHVKELPKEFDDLIRKALAPDPKARMQGALELYEQLAKIPA
jgi:hypothetical protein